MARVKISKIRVSDEELEELGINKDFYEDWRSENGFIKVSLSPWGAAMLNESMEDKIEQKRKELEELRKKYSQLEDIKEKGLSKKEKKKLKKEKKKKKKEKKRLKKLPESTKLLYGAIEEYQEKFHKDKKKKKYDIGFEGLSVKEKTKRDSKLSEEEVEKRKEEKESKEFEKRFEEPLALIRENLIDMTETLVELNDMIKETKESRARNKHVMLKDLLTTKVNLFNARASSARSMADIQRARVDLELKRVKEKGATGDERTKNIALMNKLFPQLLASGALDKGIGKSKNDDDDDYKKDKKKKKKKVKNRDSEENFEKRVTKLIKEGEIELSPHELAIDMEGKYKVAIMKSFKTGDWAVVATDLNGKIIRDFKERYPGLLPKKKDLDLRWDDEKDIAKDRKTDRIFPVIQVPHLY